MIDHLTQVRLSESFVVWMVSQCQLDTMVSLPRWMNMIMGIVLVMNASFTEVLVYSG
jgi:hypothetical protein